MHLSGVIIKNNEGDILLLHRATLKRTQWEIPGGKIEDGEDCAQAAAREAFEELGTAVRIVREIGSESFTEDGYNFHYTWFLASTDGGAPKIGEPAKYDDLRYWRIADLATTTEVLSPNTINFVRHLISGHINA